LNLQLPFVSSVGIVNTLWATSRNTDTDLHHLRFITHNIKSFDRRYDCEF